MQPEKLIKLMAVMERMKDNTRHSWTSQGRHESVAEHSWRAALLAFFMKDEFPDINIDKVIKMCLLHDIGEAVTGDIPAFSKTENDEAVEQQALECLFDSLPSPWPGELRNLFAEMEAHETKEAKLYKAIDRMEAIFQHNEADISTWLPLEYELNQTYGVEQCSFSTYTAALRRALLEETVAKIKKNT